MKHRNLWESRIRFDQTSVPNSHPLALGQISISNMYIQYLVLKLENLNSKVAAARIDRTAGTSKSEMFGPQKT